MQSLSSTSASPSFWEKQKWLVLVVTLGLVAISTTSSLLWVWSDLQRQAHAHFKVWEEDISEELLVPEKLSEAPLKDKVLAHWQGLAPWTIVRSKACEGNELSFRLPLSLYGTTSQELWICSTPSALFLATARSPQGTAMLLLTLLIGGGVGLWSWWSWQKSRLTELEIQAHRRQSLWSERLAHDLRSPLMGLRSLEEDWPSDSKPLFLATLKRLEGMADQLLHDGRRLGTSRSLRQSLKTVLEELATRFKTARQTQIIDQLGRDELIDEDVERALHALLNNAFQASEDRPVKVHLFSEEDFIRVLIRDQGPGLSEELLKRLGRERLAPSADKVESRGVGAWSAGETARARGGDLKFRPAHPHGLETEFSIRRLGGT